MVFDYTKHEKDILHMGKEIGQYLQNRDRDIESFQKELWVELAEKGLFETVVPDDLGGLGFKALEIVLFLEGLSFCWKNTGMLFSACAQLFACMVPLVKFGSAEQKEKIVPLTCKGKLILAHLMTEPESGSDCFNLSTKPIAATDDEYIISGRKCSITNAPIADYFLTYVKTKPDCGYLGISCFLIDKEREGMSVSQPYEKMGLNGSSIGDVTFDRCPVPKGDRVGREGMGSTIFTHSMNWERTCLYAIYLGMMERSFDELISFVKMRKRFGKTLASFQSVQNSIVDMKKNIEVSRLLLYRAACSLDKKEFEAIHSSLSKLFVSQAAVENASSAIQLYGAHGYFKESGVEQMLRDSIPAKIFSGTNEMQKQIIARELGLWQGKRIERKSSDS